MFSKSLFVPFWQLVFVSLAAAGSGYRQGQYSITVTTGGMDCLESAESVSFVKRLCVSAGRTVTV